MGSSKSKTTWLQGWWEPSAVESDADKIRRNDNSLTNVVIYDWESAAIEILDALKNNSVVKKVSILDTETLLPENQEAHVKLSRVMKCNKSVECLYICLGKLRERNQLFEIGDRNNERAQLFATMATSGGWSSIQELVLDDDDDDDIEPLSLREAEHLSIFIIQSENLRTLSLEITGHEAGPIMETLSRTKVQSLKLHFRSPSLQNGSRRLATALERCTCITQLRLEFPSYNDQVELFFQILLIESIPKMLGLKKFELEINRHFDQQFFDMVGQCIGGHQGAIEELRLIFNFSSVNSSIVGLAPALRRLKVIRFDSGSFLSALQIGELSGVVADCDALEEFGYNLVFLSRGKATEDFKAICQLLSKFPRLKRVTKDHRHRVVDLREDSRFVAFLEMVKTSKTIEQVPLFRCGNAEKEAAIEQHCHTNMLHNRLELIREKKLLAAKVPSSAWPLILKEFVDMSDVLYYLLQQKHGAMIGPTCHGGCKRKQYFGTLTK